MIFKRSLFLTALCAGLCLGALGAEETQIAADDAAETPAEKPVFLSITREAAPMDELPSNISVLTRDDIAKTGAKSVDEVLDRLPSVDISRTGSRGTFSTVRMRGVPSSAHVQVLVDDQPLGGVSAQFLDLSQIPVDDIERIEVVRGGSTVLYGANTTGGVINIITRRHTRDLPVSSVSWEAGSFKTQTYKAEIGAQGRGFDGRVNGSRYFTNGYQDNADADNVSLSGYGGYRFQNGARVTLDLARTDHEVGNSHGTVLPINQWDGHKERVSADQNERVETDNNLGRVRATLPLGGFGRLESLTYGSNQHYGLLPTEDAEPSFAQKTRVVGNDTHFVLPGGVTLGGSYERDFQRTVSVFSPATLNHTVDWSVYAQENFHAGGLTLIPAVRLDQHSVFGNVVNPRFTAVYLFPSELKLSANAARSFRVPSFFELFFEGPSFNRNPDLKPETAWTYDLGVEKNIGAEHVGVTGFYTLIRDRITSTANLTPPDQNINAPRAQLSGVEVETSGRWGAFSETSNYTYQRAIGNRLASSHYVPLKLTPRHMANNTISWHAPRHWRIDNTLQYVHKQFQFDNEQGIVLPSYTLWNVRVTKKILAAEIFFGVNNITDKLYGESFDGVFDVNTFTFLNTIQPQPGRTFVGGALIRFTN